MQSKRTVTSRVCAPDGWAPVGEGVTLAVPIAEGVLAMPSEGVETVVGFLSSNPDYSLPSPWLDWEPIQERYSCQCRCTEMKIDSSSTDSDRRRTKKGRKKGNNQYHLLRRNHALLCLSTNEPKFFDIKKQIGANCAHQNNSTYCHMASSSSSPPSPSFS